MSGRKVSAFAAALPDEYLLCREIGHVWQPYTATWVGKLRRFERVLRCTRCRTDRKQLLDSRGHITSSSYDYPDGYAHEGGRIMGADRDRLHLESLKRLIERTDEQGRLKEAS